jgi:hypothetical protein
MAGPPRPFLIVVLTAVLAHGGELARVRMMAAPVVGGDAHAVHSPAILQQPVVSGTVRDERGEPVVDVEVVALRRSADRRRLEIHGRGRTDDRGQYRILLRAGGPDYLLRVHGYGDSRLRSTSAQAVLMYPVVYYPAALRSAAAWPVEVEPGQERGGFDFMLHAIRGVRVSGTLPDPGTLSVRLVELALVPMEGGEPHWDLPLGLVRVPPGGRFSFSNVPPGRYMLTTVVYPVHAGQATPVARDLSARSFAGVRMTVTRGAGEHVGPPPPGDTHFIRDTIAVAGEDLDLGLRFSRGARLNGRLVFDGAAPRPSAGDLQRTVVRIVAADGADLGMVPLSGVEADGRFSVVGVPPGDYELELQHRAAFAAWHRRSLSVNGRDLTGRPISVGTTDIHDVVYTFTDRRTSIAGTLRDVSGRPVEGGTVIAFPTDRTLWTGTWVWPAFHTGQSVERGRFVVQVLGAGEYYVAGVPSVPSAIRPRLSDPAVLETLARTGTVIRLGEGQQVSAEITSSIAP